MKVLVHVPIPSPVTYDLLGLTEAQFDKIRLLLGEVTGVDRDTAEVWDAMEVKRKPSGYRIKSGIGNAIHFEET